jgi:hypothetical protein
MAGPKKLSALEKLRLIAFTVSKGKSRSYFTTEDMEKLALALMLALVYGNNYLYRYMRVCLLLRTGVYISNLAFYAYTLKLPPARLPLKILCP